MNTLRRCDFCGLEFDPAANAGCITDGCEGCPISKSCTRITCPRCGYQMLPEPKLFSLLRKVRQAVGKQSDERNA